MPIDSGDVTIAPDGSATGDGLAKALYDALADEYDAFPGQLPAASSPGAQENLAKMARAIAEPISLGVNEGIEVTADPGEVLGVALDAGAPQVAGTLTPAQLNAIVGSVVLTILQSLVMAERAAGATLADGFGQFFPRNTTPSSPYFRDDTNVDRKLLVSPAALSDLATQADATVLLRALGAGTGTPIAGSATQLNAIVGSAVLTLAQSLVMAERAAGSTLVAGQGEFYPKNDTPSAPYFRDDTNTDRKLATVPVPLTELATQAEATALLRAVGAGAGVPIAGSGAQLGEIIRFGTTVSDAVGGTFAPYTLLATTNTLVFTASATFHGITGGVEGRELLIINNGAFGGGVTISFVQFSSSTAGGNAEKILLATIQGTDSVAVICPPGSCMRLRYTSSRWRQASPIDLAATMLEARIWGRAIGAGSGNATALTPAQIRAIADSAPITEIEETGAGPFNDYNPAGARHVLCSNAAGVFTGVSVTGFVVGDEIIFSHQGTGYTEFQHNTGSAAANVFFTGRAGLSLRIFDNELAIFRLVDAFSGAGSQARWELQCPSFPFAHASVNANGDTLVHNGTNWVTVAGFQTTSTINLTPSGAVGIVDITALASGGSVTLQPTAAFNIDGFTAKPDGFWFDLHYRDTTTHLGTLNENAGAATTSIRNPHARALNFTTLITVRLRYSNTRWRSMPMGFGSDVIMRERSAGETLVAAYAQFFVKDDTPNNPYFRDDTNADRKILTGPLPLSDIATQAQGTALGRTAAGGTGVPVALTGLQQGENLRRGTAITDSTTTGVVATYALLETTTHVYFTGTGTITLHGATIIAGKPVEWAVDVGATVEVTFVNDGAPTITQERFRTPSGQASVTIRAGESVSTIHSFNRHRMGAVCKRIDPELIAPVRNQVGVPFVIPVVLTAGTPGTADDVTVFNANCPYAIEILRVDVRITTAIAATTIEGRTAAAGGGSALTDTFSGAATGPAAVTAALAAIATIAVNGSLFIRRSDRGVAGKVYLTVVRT